MPKAPASMLPESTAKVFANAPGLLMLVSPSMVIGPLNVGCIPAAVDCSRSAPVRKATPISDSSKPATSSSASLK